MPDDNKLKPGPETEKKLSAVEQAELAMRKLAERYNVDWRWVYDTSKSLPGKDKGGNEI